MQQRSRPASALRRNIGVSTTLVQRQIFGRSAPE
jgi:hypothetical protein